MQIKFTENIKLAVNDYNWGEEYSMAFSKDAIREVLLVVRCREDLPESEYFDIHFARKEVAEGVHQSVFTILT